MVNKINFEGIENQYFLIGEMTTFSNRFQTVADNFFKDISWKQCFVLICLKMFKDPPTINELSEVLGSSHQNVKQLLLKLEKSGYVEFIKDKEDKRKQRIIRTNKAETFDQNHAEDSELHMMKMFKNIKSENMKITIETLVKLEENLRNMEELR